jgi:ABC-type uncharacterized transport system permease subunit
MIDAGIIDGFLGAAVRIATPLLLAALGEMLSERGGVINLGVEGAMLTGALAAAIGASAGGTWTGLAASVVAGLLLASIFALAAIGARADQIIAGTATTLLAVGVTGAVYQAAFGSAGAGLTLPTLGASPIPGLAKVPLAGPALFNQPVTTYIACWRCRCAGGSCSALEPDWRFAPWVNRRSMRVLPACLSAASSSPPRSPAAPSPDSPAGPWCWRRSARLPNA